MAAHKTHYVYYCTIPPPTPDRNFPCINPLGATGRLHISAHYSIQNDCIWALL